MDNVLSASGNKFETPCFVYDFDFLKKRGEALKNAFGGRFQISYAVKSNPNLEILRRMTEVVDLLDISSGGELERVGRAGWRPSLISFTGPGKTDVELISAVNSRIGYMIVESLDEAERLSRIATELQAVQPILLRISPVTMPPGFGGNMAGKPCQFGIDEEEADAVLKAILQMKSIPVYGFHIYSGTQCLKANAIVENYENFIRIFKQLSDAHDLQPQKLIFGSGLGIPYHNEDQPLSLESVAATINPSLDVLRGEERFSKTDLVLEVGRYLVGEAGRYLTRVINIKNSRGTLMAICDGGMNHNLAACGLMGSVIPRNYRMFRVGDSPEIPDGQRQTYELVGPLCTSIDRLGKKVQLPELQRGDVIAVECSGAYGLTASPIHFISHNPPKEYATETIGGQPQVTDISEMRA